MATVIKEMLKNVDKELISEFQSLPIDIWDFKDEDVRFGTHGIHNYPAVMVYPISRKLLSIFKKHQPIRTLLDPYMGSGTCLVEGILADLDAVYGTDLNPLARLISRVKTKAIEPNILNEQISHLFYNLDYNFTELRKIIDKFDDYVRKEKKLDVTAKDGWGSNAVEITKEYLAMHNIDLYLPEISNLGYWFLPRVVLELQIIKNCIKLIEDRDVRNFLWVCFSEVVRLTSNRRNGEFKMYRMDKEKLKTFNPNVLEIFMNTVQKNEQKMLEFYDAYSQKQKNTQVHIYNNNAMTLENIPDEEIDIVITSPPYGDSRTTVAYGQFSRTALEWLDMHETDSTEEELDERKIRAIDSNLLGGKIDKNMEFNLPSPTLREAYEQIKQKDEKRALEVYAFYKDLNESIRAITSKMKKNGYQCWVVGNRTVKEIQLPTHQILIELAEHHGNAYVTTLVRNISNKVMPLLNSPTNKTGQKVATMTNEHIVIIRKQ